MSSSDHRPDHRPASRHHQRGHLGTASEIAQLVERLFDHPSGHLEELVLRGLECRPEHLNSGIDRNSGKTSCNKAEQQCRCLSLRRDSEADNAKEGELVVSAEDR